MDFDNMKVDDRPKKGSWAPGNYTNNCQQCGCGFVGDKRARVCADCAYPKPEQCLACDGSGIFNGELCYECGATGLSKQ